MKYIEVDDELYRYIASQTQRIGESASDILRRLLMGESPIEEAQPTPEISRVEDIAPEVKPDKPATAKQEAPVSAIESFKALNGLSALGSQKGAVGRFIYLLNALHAIEPERFNEVLAVKGKGRLYFATSKQALLESSKTANPREIGQTGYWVSVNNNTERKRIMLEMVLDRLGCNKTLAKTISEQI